MSKTATHAIAYGTRVKNPNIPATDPKVSRHMEICKELNALFERKNHDYGDSFHLSFLEEGLAMARIRLGDKYNRFKTLSRQDSAQQVDNESIRDTLIDLANYAIMTIMEIERSERENGVMELDELTVGKKLLENKTPLKEVNLVHITTAQGTGGSGVHLNDPISWTVSDSASPQDATQGLSGDDGDRIGVYKKITADDLVEAYRLALEEANEATMSALDRVIAAGKESFGAFEAEIDEEGDDTGFMEDPN